MEVCFFFFSSRRRHTRCSRDWSSDVCSSDLRDPEEAARLPVPPRPGTHVGRRIAEYELSRRGIGSHQTHYDESRLFSWMTAGFEAFEAARQAGYPPYLGRGRKERTAFEVFPYASYVALSGCLSPGRR